MSEKHIQLAGGITLTNRGVPVLGEQTAEVNIDLFKKNIENGNTMGAWGLLKRVVDWNLIEDITPEFDYNRLEALKETLVLECLSQIFNGVKRNNNTLVAVNLAILEEIEMNCTPLTFKPFLGSSLSSWVSDDIKDPWNWLYATASSPVHLARIIIEGQEIMYYHGDISNNNFGGSAITCGKINELGISINTSGYIMKVGNIPFKDFLSGLNERRIIALKPISLNLQQNQNPKPYHVPLFEDIFRDFPNIDVTRAIELTSNGFDRLGVKIHGKYTQGISSYEFEITYTSTGKLDIDLTGGGKSRRRIKTAIENLVERAIADNVNEL